MLLLNKLISRSIILGFLILVSSCRDNGNKIGYSNKNDLSDASEISSQASEALENANIQAPAYSKIKVSVKGDSLLKHPEGEANPKHRPYYHLSKDLIDHNVYYKDTVTAKNSKELVSLIASNRLIRLLDKDYILRSSSYYQGGGNEDASDKQGLLIDNIKNLKIVGTGSSRLLAYERNATVLKFSNVHNIHLDNIIIGHTEDPAYACEQGVLLISYSYNINISNCKLFGSGTFGLITYAVYNLKFLDSEITECTSLIFILERSRKFEFKNSKFHNNSLYTSVLGGFTNASQEISFLNCEFLDNQPEMPGNPAFNQSDIFEPISFTDCTFKNNKGFKWYGGQIKLENCEMDSSGFIGLH